MQQRFTAYNHGTAGMARARAAHGSDMATIIRNYTSRTFGYASKNFYAEFVAAVNVYDNYETHFGPIALDAALDFTTPALRVAGRATISPGSGQTYQVRVGDTLSVIAARHRTSVSEIMALNRLPSDRIFAGETLLVASTQGASAGGEYLVQRGDTLSHIAERFGMRLRELMDLNGLRGSTIYVGQLLIVR